MDQRRRPERRRSFDSPAADDDSHDRNSAKEDEGKRRRGSVDRSECLGRGRDRGKKARTSATSSPPIASRLRYRSRRRPPRRQSPGASNNKGGGGFESPSARSERYRKRRERRESAESSHHDRDRDRNRDRTRERERERDRSRSRDRRGNGSRATRSRTRSRSRSRSPRASGARSGTGSTGSSRRRRNGRHARRSPSGSRHCHERHEKRHSARRQRSRSPRGRRDRYTEHRAHSRRRDSYESGSHRQRRHSRDRERERGYEDGGGGYADDGRANGDAYGSSTAARDASDDSAAHDDSVGTYDGRPGDYILSRYKILREAGVGTFGRVLECVDKKRNEIVAIKVVRKVDKYTESAKIEANILQDVNDKDVRNESLCVRMHKWFEYKGHVCMVFERLGCSLYDYLKNHDYKPFPLRCIRAFAWQLLTALEYCHRIRLIHTDLKPENILLVDDDEEPWGGASPSSSASSSSSYDSPYASDRDQWSNHRQWKKRDLASSSQASGAHSDSDSQRAVLRPPASNAVKLIDFGGATYDHESKSSIINTRQYRSPEVILGLGWSYPSDIWSAGCIIAELYLGELLFATHENMEHLALIEKCIGRLPSAMVSAASKQPGSNKFFSRGRLHWPARASSDESVEHVRKMRSLDELVLPDDKRAGLADLLRLMLTPDPDDRVTAKDALSHPFFEGFSYRDVAPPSAADARDANGTASQRSHSWRD